MTFQLARDLAAIAHAHYVTPSTTDRGPSGALAERIQERLKGFEIAVKALDRIYGLTHPRRTSGIAMAMQDIAHKALSELQKAVET